ncbi:aliphatic nitrilase-like protein [Aureobasidium pullulans]|uniref:Aliphatic nitrilase-like protein n=1 Tax=Aureobasidium pullulans TaxID=5580 RepID=A0A4S9DCR1_AURPU|nr:aliphatic nitrilase-like protein [Aureobasidium pullulans]
MRLTHTSILVLAGQSAAAVLSKVANSTSLEQSFANLTVALVRSAPANWPMPLFNKNWSNVTFDINKTVELGVGHIAEAASSGANLVVFPELWFPGYPKGIDEAWIAQHSEDYYNNSLEVGSEHWKRLLTAAKDSHVYVALAFSEKTAQSIYMGQALISPYGELLHLRHKLRPSGIERYLWSDGSVDGLKVLDTEYGRWGLLECWEHFHPTMTFNMQVQREDVHIAAFPYMPDYNESQALYWESVKVNEAAARTYAVNSGAYTLFASVGYSSIMDGTGVTVAKIEASVPFDQTPILYASINTTAFSDASYDVNSEQSWAALEQMKTGFPYHVPKVPGKFFDQKTIVIEDLVAWGDAYIESKGTTSEPMPGSTA